MLCCDSHWNRGKVQRQVIIQGGEIPVGGLTQGHHHSGVKAGLYRLNIVIFCMLYSNYARFISEIFFMIVIVFTLIISVGLLTLVLLSEVRLQGRSWLDLV